MMSRTTTLSEILTVLDTFIEREGHACVPATHLERGIRLGDAIDHVRSLHAAGTLPAKAVAALQSRTGWFWERGETAEHALISAAGEFIAHHGHANFTDGSELSAAAAAVRAELEDGSISRGLFDALDSFPEWKWEDVYDYGWKDRYRELLAFEQANGHLHIPERVNGQSRLCQWATRQRFRHFAGELPASRRHRLDMVENWEWRPERAIRHRYVKELSKYREIHGNTVVACNYVTPDGYRLGDMLSRVRLQHSSGKLAAGTIQALEAIPGWTWEKPEKTEKTPAPVRIEALDAYRGFVGREGHGDVPAVHNEAGFDLGRYLTSIRFRLRKGSLSTLTKDAFDAVDTGWRKGATAPGENGIFAGQESGRMAA